MLGAVVARCICLSTTVGRFGRVDTDAMGVEIGGLGVVVVAGLTGAFVV